MLQIEKPQFVSGPAPEVSSSMSVPEAIDYALGFLRRRYLTILIPVALCVALAGLFIAVTPKTYTGSAVMMIDARKTPVLPEAVVNEFVPDSTWVDSQIGILKSDSVAGYVIKQLKLAEDPNFFKQDSGLLGGSEAPLLRRLGFEPAQPTSDAERVTQAITAFRSRIDVKRLGISYLVKIDFKSHNAEQAAKIANAVVDAYIFDQMNAKYVTSRRTTDWLQERLQSLREQTTTAERAVVEFRAKNNLVAVDGKLMNEKQLADLSNQLATARAHASDVQARLSRIEAIINGDDAAGLTADATVSDTMNNPIITKLRTQYLDLVNKEADWSTRYGKNHTAVVNLRNQMRDIRKSMVEELKTIAETYKSEAVIAKNLQAEQEQRLAELLAQSQQTKQALINLEALEATAQSYHRLYDNFLQRYTQTIEQQSFPSSEARLISPAAAYQSYPLAWAVWLIGVMVGGALGLGLAAARELTDRVFRTSGQIESVLEAECLALVPLLKGGQVGRRALADHRKRAAGRALPRPPIRDLAPVREINLESEMLRTVVEAPLSQYTEAIRSIKLSADLSGAMKSTKVIGVTSALPGEGKSSSAMALAQVATQGGARVILVDCDLRNPSLSRMLARHATAGFADVVLGKVDLEEALWTDPRTGLAFLPAVVDGPSEAHAAELLASETTRKLFERLQERYDYVIVDLSPLVPVIDVRASSRLIDGYILVVEWGRTKMQTVQRALSSARGVQENVMGIVLNKVDMKAIRRYDKHGARYYHRNKYVS
jgi:succinoglycan biosynthesis transport protein ExoP